MRGVFVILALTMASAGAASARRAMVKVTPALSYEDQPVHIGVSGLAPRERVTLQLRSSDAQRTPWLSSAVFRADASGSIDLDHARALSGTYTGVWGMGLVATMRATRHSPAGAYFWGSGPLVFGIRVRARRRTIASTASHRKLGPFATRRVHETLQASGFIGDYWAPVGLTKRPAILAFGGSEGGETTYFLGALLAARGYPALSLAYFKERGLPQTLANIPLEYFANALEWLRGQPEVDPDRVVVSGGSRGSEAALLLGVHFPSLVQAVIANVPSNVSLCSLPNCDGPAWTLNGQPVPFTRQFDQPRPTDEPAAVIPVEQIQGPAFLDCGGNDLVWVSCSYSRAIVARLDASHVTYRHELHVLPNAGHFVGALVPYEPGYLFDDPASERGREQLWPALLRFLAGL